MSVVAARAFLDTIRGANTNPDKPPSTDRPIRLAVVEEVYTSGLVHVRFEGEEGVGSKGYAALESYNPQPGDRVCMVPIGSTYLILGVVDPSPRQFPEWRTITSGMFSNGWHAFTTVAFQADPEYIRTGDGWVKLKGLISGGTITDQTVLLTLPPGYRPTGQLHFPTVSNTTASGAPNPADDNSAMLRVRPSGEVVAGPFGIGKGWVSLDSVTFVAEA